MPHFEHRKANGEVEVIPAVEHQGWVEAQWPVWMAEGDTLVLVSGTTGSEGVTVEF